MKRSFIAVAFIVGSGLAAGSVKLAWDDNSTNEDTFRIERKEGSGSFVEIKSVPANTTTFEDVDAKYGVPYEYRVRAHNTAGFSDYSNTASTTLTLGQVKNIRLR